MKKHRLLRAFKIAGIALVAIAIFGFVVEGIWNWLVPVVFGWRPITFTQALGLLVLSKILFGGWHRHGGGRYGWKRGMGGRWASLSPEERERFRAGLRAKTGFDFAKAAEPSDSTKEC